MIFSLSDAILFFILFWFTATPLLTDIFKLLAFIGFAALVIAFLQSRAKIQEMEIEIGDQRLHINYFRSSEKNSEELFELDTIDQIQKLPAPPIWRIFPRRGCTKMEISFTDTSNKLSLFRFQGRDRYLTPSEAQKIETFLQEHIPLQ
jgi:hypothetical protein